MYLTQDAQEEQLNVNLKGNLSLERVHRDQSGIYGCRVEDFDAGEDVQLVKTLELRVACESFGGRGDRMGSGFASSSPSGSPPWLLPTVWKSPECRFQNTHLPLPPA